MANSIRSFMNTIPLVRKPYYAPGEEKQCKPQYGNSKSSGAFNLDIYGVRTTDDEPVLPPPEKYGRVWAELENIAKSISQHTTGSCMVEVIPFPSVPIVAGREGRVRALIRLRISYQLGMDEPLGPPEQLAVAEVEKELKALGIAPRQPTH